MDNAVIEVDSLEVPILDGSSQPWVELIKRAGVVALQAPRAFLRILKRVEVGEKNRVMSIEPADAFRITCEIDFPHPLIGNQQREVWLYNGNYAAEVAPARTFGFVEELEQLKQSGLGRGGSLENAIALTRDGILNPEPLRFADEFVRHKILDIIGDLALCGMPILGHVRACRSGHGLHTRLLCNTAPRPHGLGDHARSRESEIGQLARNALAARRALDSFHATPTDPMLITALPASAAYEKNISHHRLDGSGLHCFGHHQLSPQFAPASSSFRQLRWPILSFPATA